MSSRLLPAIALLGLLGFGISAYLTSVHYARVPLACPQNAIVNCVQVTQSPYSLVPGTDIPITVPGMLWFIISGGLALWRMRPSRNPASVVTWAGLQLAFSAIGLLSALYLVFVEIVLLRQICEWCTAVHLLILLTFILALVRFQGLLAAPGDIADH